MATRSGSCHCGAVEVSYDSDAPLAVRACQCSFCRKHGSRNISDPDGQLTIRTNVVLTRYRFGLGMTDFLICPNCGVYVAAVMDSEVGVIGTVNANCLKADVGTAQPISYSGEDAGERASRREERWTPTLIEERHAEGTV